MTSTDLQPIERSERHPRLGPRLFLLSFASLFLELMVIRWVPSVVRLVAYYANLLLISSFLGLGVGAMLSRRRGSLFAWFPPLLLFNVGLLLACRWATMTPSAAGGGAEWRFHPATGAAQSPLLGYCVLVAIFVVNTAVFVPLGEQIGRVFERLPALRAYTWDLGGSLCGTIGFGLFAIWHFDPVIGAATVAAIYLALATNRQRIIGAPLLLACIIAMVLTAQRGAIWSPYYYITVAEVGRPEGEPVSPPPLEELRAMRDPPVFNVSVNQDFYQLHYTTDLSRYVPGTPKYQVIEQETASYRLPYQIAAAPREVLVLGAGGGPEVETALLQGATHVDAVDIDPMLIRLSRRINASGVYDDPRVSVHVDDARAFLRATDPSRRQYDMVVYGYLDSQALFSYGASVRLDGFTYTVESFRRAFELLKDDGVLVVAFSARVEWLARKLDQMIREATGAQTIAYMRSGNVVICAPRGQHKPPSQSFGGFERIDLAAEPIDLARDDWPYLYLKRRTIPRDYLIVIGSLLALSAGAVLAIRGRRFGAGDGHFMFLGLGFLLLQTKSIGDCSLYFGTTWLVSTIVITGVLLMVLLANLLALRLPRPTVWFYLPLMLALVALSATSREWVLSLPFGLRLAWALLVVPLPIFFAGLIFSTTFRAAAVASAAFGANLVGATLGGFGEYLGMATGTRVLWAIVVAAYVGSLACLVVASRRARAADVSS